MTILSKEELTKIKQGEEPETLGIGPKNDFELVLEKEGTEGVKKVEKEMENIGCPIKYEEIEILRWYPAKINSLLAVIRRVLNWDDKTLWEIGRCSAKISFVSKIMARFFVSPEYLMKQVGKYWHKYHRTGQLEVEEYNKKEKYLILTLKNWKVGFPEHCIYFAGYFWQIASYVFPKENLTIEEIECPFKGGRAHRFKINF